MTSFREEIFERYEDAWSCQNLIPGTSLYQAYTILRRNTSFAAAIFLVMIPRYQNGGGSGTSPPVKTPNDNGVAKGGLVEN